MPTLVTYEALATDGERFGLPPASISKIEDVRSAGIASLSILREAGVEMAFGTDLLGETQVRQSEEFSIRARVLPSHEIFASATTTAAKLIGMQGKLGVIKIGALADLLVVDGNPISDITLLANPSRFVKAVIKGGAIHRSEL